MGKHDQGIPLRELLKKVSDDALDGMLAVHSEPTHIPWPPSPKPRTIPRDPELAMRTYPYRVPSEVERRAARLTASHEFLRLTATATTMPQNLLRACLAQYARERLGAFPGISD